MTGEIRAGDSTLAKIEEGLEHSRVPVLCMSAHAFGSDQPKLESYTFRFRDPLNNERRFIPLRLDEAPIPGSLAQFSYINWLSKGRKKEYAKLLEGCRPPAKLSLRLRLECPTEASMRRPKRSTDRLPREFIVNKDARILL